ncbi:MAG: hypothetical protein L7G96_07980, partial [Vulcanisaeta sp.]|nr:hypothetical protein [Vulcanisaeta sp.]
KLHNWQLTPRYVMSQASGQTTPHPTIISTTRLIRNHEHRHEQQFQLHNAHDKQIQPRQTHNHTARTENNDEKLPKVTLA